MEYQISYILRLSTPQPILIALLNAGFMLFIENRFTGKVITSPEPDSTIPIESVRRTQIVYHCIYNGSKEPDIKVDPKWVIRYTMIYDNSTLN